MLKHKIAITTALGASFPFSSMAFGTHSLLPKAETRRLFVTTGRQMALVPFEESAYSMQDNLYGGGVVLLTFACFPYLLAATGDLFGGKFAYLINEKFLPIYDETVDATKARKAEILWKLWYNAIGLGSIGRLAIAYFYPEGCTLFGQESGNTIPEVLVDTLSIWSFFYWVAFLKIEVEANRVWNTLRGTEPIMTSDRLAIQLCHAVFHSGMLASTGRVSEWPMAVKISWAVTLIISSYIFLSDYILSKPSITGKLPCDVTSRVNAFNLLFISSSSLILQIMLQS